VHSRQHTPSVTLSLNVTSSARFSSRVERITQRSSVRISRRQDWQISGSCLTPHILLLNPSFLSFLCAERAGSEGHSEDGDGSYRSSVRFSDNPACYFFPLAFCLVFSLFGFFFLEEFSLLSPVLGEAFSVGMLPWLGIWCAGVAHQI
jgi:hypothetical protein